MKKSALVCLCSVAFIAGAVSSKGQILYNVSVGAYSGNDLVLPNTGSNLAFNEVSPGATTTLESESGSSAAGVTFADSFVASGSYGGSAAYPTNPPDFENSYLYNNRDSSFTLSHLTIGDSFTLVVYADGIQGDGPQSFTLDGGIGGNSGSTLTTDSSRDVSAGIGTAYNTFTGTVGPTGDLVVSFALNADDRVDFNGLQIKLSPVTSTVPEPSTWALMFLGLGGLVLAARRRVL